ncbi:MAG: hypothetical protein IJP28_00430 [Erysipelotrichales bacterium]|nr:hypothetical protein [Erysipelotrichales bacterium]
MKRVLLVMIVMMLCSCRLELKGNSVNYYEKTEGLQSIVDSDSRLTKEEKSVLLQEKLIEKLNGSVLYENEMNVSSTFLIEPIKERVITILQTMEYEPVEYFDGAQRICIEDEVCISFSEKEQGYSIIGEGLMSGYRVSEEDTVVLAEMFENLKVQRFLLDYSDVYDYEGERVSNVPFLEHEANKVFLRGFSAITLFTKRLLPVSSITVIDEEGNTYYRIAEQRFQYYEDFVAYLTSVFTPELVDRCLSEENEEVRYLDRNGYTVMTMGKKVEGPIDVLAYTVVEQEEDRVVFEVLAEQLTDKGEKSGTEYNFQVEMVLEEEWRISDFSVK